MTVSNYRVYFEQVEMSFETVLVRNTSVKGTIRVHNKDLKSIAYKTLVRPQLEYASTVWYPTTTKI